MDDLTGKSLDEVREILIDWDNIYVNGSAIEVERFGGGYIALVIDRADKNKSGYSTTNTYILDESGRQIKSFPDSNYYLHPGLCVEINTPSNLASRIQTAYRFKLVSIDLRETEWYDLMHNVIVDRRRPLIICGNNDAGTDIVNTFFVLNWRGERIAGPINYEKLKWFEEFYRLHTDIAD